ncbi:MAG: protein translocase SEC61 complex subunit gamma, partial [Nanoarchaeota archaeon]|nr:protein translocase SEC61 complex subunit gamma [Nanoarchaeota archaeon]
PKVEAKPEVGVKAEHKEHKEKKKSETLNTVKNMSVRLKSFYLECRRVLKVTQKPSKNEALTVIKISALGMLIIGMIGFVIKMAHILLIKGGL